MARKMYSVQRMSPTGGWSASVDFQHIPIGEARGALRMADALYGGPRWRIWDEIEGKVVDEAGGRPLP